MRLAHGYPLGASPSEAKDIEVSDEERSRGIYTLGLPGSGKTSGVYRTQTYQDVADGRGFGLLDVESTLVGPCLRTMAAHGTPPDRIILIDPTRTDAVVPLNFLKVPAGVHPQSVLEGVVSSMRRCWWDSWGPRSDDLTRNSLALLMEHNLTLAEFPRLLSDAAFRKVLVERSTNERVRLYFDSHLGKLRESERRTWFEPIRNKSDQFVNPFLEPFLAADECVDLRAVMDDSRYLLAHLPEAELKDAGRLFAMLLTNAIYQAALSRPEGSSLWPLMADEYQTVATQTFEHISTRCRKRGVGVVVSHQSTAQSPFDKDRSIVDTLLNTCAVTMFFQLGRKDAEELAAEIFPLTGTVPKRTKSKHPFWGGEELLSFYSIQEEKAFYASQLEHQKQRECFVKVRRRDGIEIYVAEAYEVPELEATDADAEALAKESLEAHGVPLGAIHASQLERLERFSQKHGKRATAAASVRPSEDTGLEGDPYGPL